MTFAHLHVHTDASPDGMTPVKTLVKTAAQKRFQALAITDHGTLANVVKFSMACNAHNIKPLIGVEGYIELDNSVGHITLLADGQEGWNSLVTLQNAAHAAQKGRKPTFTLDMLTKHSRGIVCLSGCMASPLQRMSNAEALKLGATLKAAFGNRFFSELMLVNPNMDVINRSIMLKEKLGINIALSNDVHFPSKSDGEYHKHFTRIRAGYGYDSQNLWLQTVDELVERGRLLGLDSALVLDAINRSGKIASLLKPVNFASEPKLPYFKNADSQLRETVEKSNVIDWFNAEYKNRIEFELDVIRDMGYSAYFLILSEVVDFANDNDVKMGYGRGSGAGSLVLYALGVTHIDPMLYDLSFERFLNPHRKGMPDVDMDFDSASRHLVLDYAQKRWNSAPVATEAHYSHRILTNDLSRYLKLESDTQQRVLEAETDDSEAYRQVAKDEPLFDALYQRMKGQIRHRGKHAGGVIITDELVPFERSGEELLAAWTEGNERELSYAGIVKFDFLGLTVLNLLKRLEDNLGVKPSEPVKGDPVFELFHAGKLTGVFQFGGSGIIDLTKRIKPNRFEDLVVINALYRPGALSAGTAEKYPEFMSKPRKLDPRIDDILEETYGVIVYQEQFMKLYARMTGGDLAEADLARRVIVKSDFDNPDWLKKFNDLKAEFINKAGTLGYGLKLVKKVWGEIATHAQYSFNKSHAVCYARLAWDTAWFKYHYPVHFWTELLNVDSGEALAYAYAASRDGIEFAMPDINRSGIDYTTDGTKIFLPLTAIKFLGENSAVAIVNERAKRSFTSVEDFLQRVPKRAANKRVKELLLKIGAFEGLTGDKSLLADCEFNGVNQEVQKEALNFFVPSKALLEKIDDFAKLDYIGGVVVATKNKKSDHGAYTVYTTNPPASFWARDDFSFEAGDVVMVKTNNYGRVKKAVML